MPKLQAALHGWSGKCALDELGRLVADVEVDAVEAAALHLVVDGARHDIARRQLAARVVRRHERRRRRAAAGPPSPRTASVIRKDLALRVVQAGRVELHELHVGHAAAGAPGHGDAVAGGGVRVAGVEIDLAGAAGGEHHEARAAKVSTRPVALFST